MIYLALGRRETGKTTLAYYLVSNKAITSRVIFDPRALIPAPHGRARDLDDILEAFDRQAGDPHVDVVVTPDRDKQACFDQMCLEVRGALDAGDHPRRIGLLVDEIRFIDTKAEPFDWLLRCATRASVSIVMTAHRPKDVPVDIRAIADVWLLFRTTQEHDLVVLHERLPPAVVAQVAGLGDRQFIAWDDSVARARAYTTPARWFVPLRRSGDPDPLTTALDSD